MSRLFEIPWRTLGPNTTFGRLTIQRPAIANAPNADEIGVRLFQNEDSTQ
jgi:hypothetical protein